MPCHAAESSPRSRRTACCVSSLTRAQNRTRRGRPTDIPGPFFLEGWGTTDRRSVAATSPRLQVRFCSPSALSTCCTCPCARAASISGSGQARRDLVAGAGAEAWPRYVAAVRRGRRGGRAAAVQGWRVGGTCLRAWPQHSRAAAAVEQVHVGFRARLPFLPSEQALSCTYFTTRKRESSCFRVRAALLLQSKMGGAVAKLRPPSPFSRRAAPGGGGNAPARDGAA